MHRTAVEGAQMKADELAIGRQWQSCGTIKADSWMTSDPALLPHQLCRHQKTVLGGLAGRGRVPEDMEKHSCSGQQAALEDPTGAPELAAPEASVPLEDCSPGSYMSTYWKQGFYTAGMKLGQTRLTAPMSTRASQ